MDASIGAVFTTATIPASSTVETVLQAACTALPAETSGGLSAQVGLVVAVMSAVIAALAALGTFLTLREMAAQRKLSYRPDLLLVKSAAYGTTADGFEFEWHRHEGQLLEPDALEDWPGLQLVNVGRAAVKNLRIQWIVEIEGFTAIIDKLAAISGVDLKIEYDAEAKFLSIERPGLSLEFQNVEAQSQQEIPYLLPLDSGKTPSWLNPPSYLLRLCELAAVVESQAPEIARFGLTPPVTTEVTFLDLEDAEHRLSYRLGLTYAARYRTGVPGSRQIDGLTLILTPIRAEA